jgi:hypothetical protein
MPCHLRYSTVAYIGNDFEQSLHALAPDPNITEPSSLMEQTESLFDRHHNGLIDSIDPADMDAAGPSGRRIRPPTLNAT